MVDSSGVHQRPNFLIDQVKITLTRSCLSTAVALRVYVPKFTAVQKAAVGGAVTYTNRKTWGSYFIILSSTEGSYWQISADYDFRFISAGLVIKPWRTGGLT